MRYAGLLLDLDRTLVDVQTYTDYETAVAGIPEAASVGVATPQTDWRSATRLAMDTLVALSGTPRWQEVSDHIERFELAAVPRSQVMPGVADFLAAVPETPVAVVTLMGPGAARAALAAHGLDFEVVLGRTARHRPKPAPDQLVAACGMIGTACQRTVMIGDSSWDAVAAEAGGCEFIGLTLGGSVVFPPGTSTVPWLGEVVALLD